MEAICKRAVMDVWQTIRSNKENGAKQLVAEFGDRLFAAAFLLCHDDHGAEDLVFRTFARAIEKIALYRPTGDFFGWLYAILLNFWRMELRRKHLDIVYVGTPEDLPAMGADLAPDDVRRVSDEALRQAVFALPPGIRDVVVMKYYREMSVEGIAATLAVPAGTVKSRLFTARKLLALSIGKARKERRG